MGTDEEWIRLVRKQWKQKPHMAATGACCLVGIICKENLYVANAGDSRVVLGRLYSASPKGQGLRVRAMQLSTDHNARMETERQELQSLHPFDPHIVVQKYKAWRVKGIIQVLFPCFFLVFSLFS